MSKEGSGVLRNIALTWLMDGSNHISYCPNRALLRVNGNARNSFTGQEALMEMVPCIWSFHFWGEIYSKMVTVRMINIEHRQNHRSGGQSKQTNKQTDRQTERQVADLFCGPLFSSSTVNANGIKPKCLAFPEWWEGDSNSFLCWNN